MTVSIILNIVLFISNIVVFFIQRTTIKHLRLRNSELERTNKAALDLSEGTGKALETFKGVMKIEDIQATIDFKVSTQLSAAVDRVIADTAKSMVEDSQILERATRLVSEDLFKFCQSSINFVVYLFFQLNFTEDAIKAVAKNFFKDHPNAENMMLEELIKLKLRFPNGISLPEKKKDQIQPTIPGA